MFRYENLPLIFVRKHVARIKFQPQRSDVRTETWFLKKEIHLFGSPLRPAQMGSFSSVGVVALSLMKTEVNRWSSVTTAWFLSPSVEFDPVE